MAYINGKQILFSSTVDGMAGANQLAADVATLRVDVDTNTRRVDALFKLNEGVTFQFEKDETTAYSKVVPSGAKLASINRIGGMSSAVDGVLVNAKVTEVKSESANVLDIDGEEWGVTGWFTSVENGIKIGSFSKNSYEFTAKSNHINITSYSSGSLFPWLSKFIKLKPNTTYRLYQSADNPYVSIVGLNDTAVGTVGTKMTFTDGTFNSGGYKHWMISFYGTGSADVMINYGDTSLPFTPYAEYEPLTIPSAVQALDGYGLGVDAEYSNHIDWEEKKYHKDVGQCVFDGTENVTISPTQMVEGYTRFDVWKSKEGAGAKSDRCVCNKYGYNGANKVGVWFNNSSPDKLEFRIMTNEFSNSNELTTALKQWYAEGNPLAAIYPLAVPTETDLTDLLADDNTITVEAGGALVFDNEHSMAVPSEVEYAVKLAEV